MLEVRTAHEEKEKLNEFLARARKLESVGQLAGGVAHDFNNMIGAILGSVDLAMDLVPRDAPVFAELEEIESAAKRSAVLTRQLLTFARQQPVRFETLNPNEAIQNLASMLERLIRRSIHLEFRPGKMVPDIRIDRSQLDQILTNLVINARDAIEGEGTILLETAPTEIGEEADAFPDVHRGPAACISVSDTGCGMDENVISRIFEPFFTTRGDQGGTGLGLATVYGHVRMNHGLIKVESTLQKGTSFKLLFPAENTGSPTEQNT